MTASTSGYVAAQALLDFGGDAPSAAWTSSALATGSESSRKAQACCRSGMRPSLAVLQKAREVLADLGMPQAELDRRLQVAELRAAVEAPPGRRTASTRSCTSSAEIASVSWISPPAPGVDLREQIEDARRQHIAPDHRRGSTARRRAWASRRCCGCAPCRPASFDGDDAVALRLVARHLLHAEERGAFARRTPPPCAPWPAAWSP